ncbi:MAG: cytochrome c-type biogenesis protein CcmH [Gammaproteobacteria bacterium]|nr:MAG: cytochrome c-type biogenesis protein CcmH [Gammaproteobacteria bacterium]
MRPDGVLLRSLILGLLLIAGHGQASSIDVYEFDTREQEARFHALNAELRCPKCLNTNLWGSDAPIARDLRRTVATMLREGHSDREIRNYLVSRYGDFILYNPRFTAKTAVLWIGPFVLLFLGLAIIGVMIRNQRRAARAGDQLMTPADAERVARLRAELRQDTSGAASRS